MKETIMNDNVYFRALQRTVCAFAYPQAVFDYSGKMIDYIFLEVNKAFENATGLKREDIIGKRYMRDVMKGAGTADKWISIYSTVLTERRQLELDEYSEELGRHYMIIAYPDGEDRFVTIFNDKTFQKRMQEIGQYFIDNLGKETDYSEITDLARDITGAEYASFNLYSKEDGSFTTTALSGLPDGISKAVRILGFDVVGRTWEHDNHKDEMTGSRDITVFETLGDLTQGKIMRSLVRQLVRIFGIGNVVVAKTRKEGKALGDFTLFFKKGVSLRNKDLLILYMSQLALFLERNSIDAALRSNQKMFYTLAEHAPVGFVSCDRTGRIIYVNRKLLEIMEVPSYESALKVDLFDLPALKPTGFAGKLRECMDNDKLITYETSYAGIWGGQIWLKVSFTPNKDNGKVIGANIVVDDISDVKKKEEDLTEKMIRDPLTRAYNRNVLDTLLKEKLNKAKKDGLVSCVAVLDVDDFKDINDNFGHKTGDNVLKHVALITKQELKNSDMLVRTGGDEFLFYIHNVAGIDDADARVRRIFRCLSGNTELGIPIDCSIGVSMFPMHGETVETLTAKADEALYKVKKNGKANICFSDLS